MMCGIVGYIGNRKIIPLLIDSLRRLEYRGYDSAGIGVIDSELSIVKSKGTIDELQRRLENFACKSRVGIGHTRWATHGKPSDENAHPHIDCKGEIAVIHNGILENFSKIKGKLMSAGHKFSSETDTEVLAHLIESNYNGDLELAVRVSLREIEGSYAVVVIHKNEKERIVVARNESPLVLGLGEDENFVASDVPALLKYTDRVIYLEDKEMAVLTKDEIKITTLDNRAVKREWKRIEWSLEDAEKSGYEHFMLKEIFEQPRAIHDALLGRVADNILNGNEVPFFDSIKIVACGTSYHAGLVGKYLFERVAKIPTIVEMSSEYRYSEPTTENPLVIVITQSGETADTLAAVREARKRGNKTLAITNVVGSTVTREADYVFYTRAGPEIGVAATKTFTTQIIALYLLAIYFGREKSLEPENSRALLNSLRKMPRYAENVLEKSEIIRETAKRLADSHSIFFIGRNINYPIALEGALKLKEISYIHAEGYPAGELKHGPLALLTEETPIIALTPRDHTYEKMIGNIREVSARDSPVIAVAEESDKEIEKYVDVVLRIPDVESIFSPIPIAIALQLLAYHVAKERNCPIDKPRNLAKSVTVE